MYVLSLNFLRLLIVISLVLYLSYFFAPHFYESSYDEEVLQLLFTVFFNIVVAFIYPVSVNTACSFSGFK